MQQTWLDRANAPDPAAIKRRAEARIGKHARAVKSAYGTQIVKDLATLIELFVPAPTETEGRFWSVTDYPPTGYGGRSFTLNVGGVELAYCGRTPKGSDIPPAVVLNAPAGTFLSGSGLYLRSRFDNFRRRRAARRVGHAAGEAYFGRVRYKSIGDTDRLGVPVGTLLETLAGVSTPQQSAESIRAMSLAVMRQGATPWAKSHSKNLATMAYREIASRCTPIVLPERGDFEK